MISKRFIRATEQYNTFEAPVPAPYFRKEFSVADPSPVTVTVACRGFYELWWNGERVTKGLLSPYISNPEHIVYADEYTLIPDKGQNVIGVLLGNGFQNNPGGYVWDFDRASFRSAPSFSLRAEQKGTVIAESDETFRTAPSPIQSDDYRFGEVYDATREIPGWNQKGFDDSAWAPALPAEEVTGDLRIADVTPIREIREIAPLSVERCGDGYLYDFGRSGAGVCRLTVRGERNQKIELRHADGLKDGDLDLQQIWFPGEKYDWDRDREIVHRDVYICKGGETEVYIPTFTYHGFRYVRVDGITPEQATKDLLTYRVCHTDLTSRGDFSCSDPVANQLQTLARRSILSNFHHFPTDCPQREKNGWTADGALTCEAALMNFDPERNYREWMRNICKAQGENGSLPGIVPTGGWGFHWGNGPAWDCVLVWLPAYTYLLRGETEMIRESAEHFLSYLRYLRTRVDEKGLLAIGLGDWCHVGGFSPKAPLSVTDSITAMDIAGKIALMLSAIGRDEDAAFAEEQAAAYRKAVRESLLDRETLQIAGECQTSQAMGLFYGIFEEDEKDQAFARLLEMVRAADGHLDTGVLGGRVLFRVLSDFGEADLAYRMITREDYPSFGNWLKRGATTLWENFHPHRVSSMNHHFWGDFSAWFIQYLGGIRPNPGKNNADEVLIAPEFIPSLTWVKADYTAPKGKIETEWHREDETVTLTLGIPEEITATARLPRGYRFADGRTEKAVTGGVYEIVRETE